MTRLLLICIASAVALSGVLDGTVTVIDLDKAEVTTQFKAGTGIETLTYY
jgi:hypothetical protein